MNGGNPMLRRIHPYALIGAILFLCMGLHAHAAASAAPGASPAAAIVEGAGPWGFSHQANQLAAGSASPSSELARLVIEPKRPWIERIEAWQVIAVILLLIVLAVVVLLGVFRWKARRTVAESGEDRRGPNAGDRSLILHLCGLASLSADDRRAVRRWLIRILIAGNLLLGGYYLVWRFVASINWVFWPLALALLAAETYSYVDSWLFGLTVWRLRQRPEPPLPRGDETVDVFITCYNEPVELVRETVRAAVAIRHSHRTYVLDDGNSPAMRAMAEEEGCGYIVRSGDWHGRDRHAKAGNLNNALFQTDGEFLLILDADQVPFPEILDRTLGYFRDPKAAFVQTPQWFKNVPPGDPFGSQAPLFYGPIQQGKDGWNAAFFCGSNAVLRRESLLFAGLVNYGRDLSSRIRRALAAADELLVQARKTPEAAASPQLLAALDEVRDVVRQARADLKTDKPLQEITWDFQRRIEQIGRTVVAADLAQIREDLAGIADLSPGDEPIGDRLASLVDDEEALRTLAGRGASPLAAIDAVRTLLLTVDVDREHEALPIMPMATISVTEDIATAMRLHALGWTSVFHNEVLAHGLAPEDLRTALQQRLRWAQGTIQVMLRESPLRVPGLSLGQRMMYFATMWSYLSGFFALVYLAAPVLYLLFGWSPVQAYSREFFWRLVPYLIVNQLLFAVVGWGMATWRGQQYSLALFPIWIKSVTSAVGSVYLGRKLGFVVTPKTRQGGVSLQLIRPQLIAMGCLVGAIVIGLVRLAVGATHDDVPVLINVGWALYDLVALSAVLEAVAYRPPDAADAPTVPPDGVTAASVSGRVAA